MLELFSADVSRLDGQCYRFLSKSCPYIKMKLDDLTKEIGLFLLKNGNVWVLKYGTHNLGYFTERDVEYPENLFVKLITQVHEEYGSFKTYRFAMGRVPCMDYTYNFKDHYKVKATLESGISASLTNYGSGKTLENTLDLVIKSNIFDNTTDGAIVLCSKLHKTKDLWYKFTPKEVKEGLKITLLAKDHLGNRSILRISNM